jgi:hypothetical protein
VSRRTAHPTLVPVAIALAVVTGIALVALTAPYAAGAAEPGDDDFLGAAEEFAIIASDTITETAPHLTEVTGDVGLDPGTDVQLLVAQVDGDIHISNTASATADADLNTAYVIVANEGATAVVGTVNLATQVTPYFAGVYFSPSDLLLDGTITLSGAADDVFIFQASTGSLTVLADSVVLIVGGAQACNVYWQVGSSATLGTNSTFVGTILAATSIAAQNGARIEGRLLAGATNAGAVTLDNNVVNSTSACLREQPTQGTGGGGETGTSPTPVGLLAETGASVDGGLAVAVGAGLLGFALLIVARRRSADEAS